MKAVGPFLITKNPDFNSYLSVTVHIFDQRGESMKGMEEISWLFEGTLKAAVDAGNLEFEKLQEIRLRCGQPVLVVLDGKEWFLTEKGELDTSERKAYRAEPGELRKIMERACDYSGYAFEEEIKRGYVTIAGGHRIGLAGRAVLGNGCIQTVKYISALNIRIAHGIEGCAEKLRAYVYIHGRPCHILIISPPGCGKTTLLRDMIRMYSNGTTNYPGVTVGVVDERSEIGGTYRERQTCDLGIRTDVLDGCPKAFGVEMLLRSMSPKVLAVDEIGTEDVPSLEQALRCGCKVLATLHGDEPSDYKEKPGFQRLVEERVFDRYIFLESGQTPGKIRCIYGKNFEVLKEGKMCT